MANLSYWSESSEIKRRPPLLKNIAVDTLVVGGGLMGVSAAYLLAKAGQKVALIERDTLTSGDTCHTTAHLTAVTDTRLTDLAKTFGDTGTRALWDAGDAAIQKIREIAAECRIDCDLATIPGYLHLAGATGNDEIEQLHSDVKVASRLEIPAEFKDQIPFFATPGIRFPNQARFHPTKYIAGLVKELDKLGCLLFEDTSADEFLDDGTIKAGGFAIEAGKTIIATHKPITGHAGQISSTLLQTKLYLFTSYVQCAAIPKHSIPDCLFWDTEDPYNYVRLQPAEQADYVIYGGKDHKTGQADDTEAVFSGLADQLKRLLSQHRIDGKMIARWSGQVVETNDGAPFIGETADNQFAATGFAGNGMTFGTLAAMMASDWVRGQKNPWTGLLSPSRKKLLGGTLEFIKENVDYPYYLIRDRIRAAEGTSITQVKPGEGKILKIDGERLAVYRDPSGEVVKLSPVCTHLGCIINWNDAESTWDCPCHGSRFHPTGEVMGGPAETPLERK
jgi:glycine/D-amino acid oxidase-like deaminating enzyme/nitrite reductase/ring-hydroxylating ferredoxin subunit